MFGVHFIKGGMYSFVRALQTLNEELGTQIYTNANVEEIIIDSRYKHADGLKVNGHIEKYDKIICTADFPYATSSLIKMNIILRSIRHRKLIIWTILAQPFNVHRG